MDFLRQELIIFMMSAGQLKNLFIGNTKVVSNFSSIY